MPLNPVQRKRAQSLPQTKKEKIKIAFTPGERGKIRLLRLQLQQLQFLMKSLTIPLPAPIPKKKNKSFILE